MGFEAPEVEKFDGENDGENFEEVSQETSNDIITAPEGTLESSREEINASKDEKAEGKGFMQGLAKRKTAKGVLAAAALAGAITATAGEAFGGTKKGAMEERARDAFDRLDRLTDEMDDQTEIIQETPSKRALATQKSERKDPFEHMDRVGELANTYNETKTDAERDRIAGQLAKELIFGGGNSSWMKENTPYVLNTTLIGGEIKTLYIISDGVARGTLEGTFLKKTHAFQFTIK